MFKYIGETRGYQILIFPIYLQIMDWMTDDYHKKQEVYNAVLPENHYVVVVHIDEIKQLDMV